MHQLVLVIGVERRHFRYNTDKISYSPYVEVFIFKIDARYLKTNFVVFSIKHARACMLTETGRG